MTGTFFDLLFVVRRGDLFAIMSRYLIGLGLLGAAVSIASGWVDLLKQVELGVGTGVVIQHRLHSLLAYAATALYLAVFLGRWRRPDVPRWTIALSVIGALLVSAAGWFGGELRRVM